MIIHTRNEHSDMQANKLNAEYHLHVQHLIDTKTQNSCIKDKISSKGTNVMYQRKCITLRLCLARVKAFLENNPFSGNAIFWKGKCFHVFSCHKIRFTENQFWCLVHSNIFIENALHTQFSIHFLSCKHADNESIPHSFTKETKSSEKIHQIRSNWDCTAEEKMR